MVAQIRTQVSPADNIKVLISNTSKFGLTAMNLPYKNHFDSRKCLWETQFFDTIPDEDFGKIPVEKK